MKKTSKAAPARAGRLQATQGNASIKLSPVALSVAIALGAPGYAYAQDAAAPTAAPAPAMAAAEAPQELNEIVVTASRGDKTRLQSSISVNDVGEQQILDFTPRSEAEVLRTIPGLNLQDTAGPGGNANIGVRGIPVSTGGSEYVALQEDGLPVTLFGDMQFGNNDYWLRFDSNVERVEAVRGGSTSTYASQAPGAVINYISKTGDVAGGSVGISEGLSYDETRLDFDYGGKIADGLRFHIGGFLKDGKGPTDIPYTAEKGYQVKFNITKDINDGKGFIRFNFKRLDDQEPTYTSMPALASLSGNQITSINQLGPIDARKYSSSGLYNQNFQILNGQGTLQNVQMVGIHPNVTSFGGEFQNDFGADLIVDDKFRWSSISGVFANQWTGEGLTSSVLGSTLNGSTVGSLVYAAGPNKGQVYNSPYVNNGAQAYVTMNDMGSFANDLQISRNFALAPESKLTVKGGWFHMSQNIATDWRINNALLSLNSTNNPVPLDAFAGANGAGAQLTANGLTGFNNQWGGCCGGREYNLTYVDDAPNLNLEFKPAGPFDIDGSVRYDRVQASGSSFSPVQGANITAKDALGSASLPAYYTGSSNTDLVDYTVHYTSWSLGGLWEIDHDTTAFVRASRGGRANADRMLYSGDFTSTGALNAGGLHNAVNFVSQQEIGIKKRGEVNGIRYYGESTLFFAQVTEHNYDFTHNLAIDATYKSYGLENDGSIRWGHFAINGSLVYTHASTDGSGNVPTAMPQWTYRITPTYDVDAYEVGATLNGQTSTYTCCGTYYLMPGNYFVNAFGKVRLYENLEVGVNVNNLFNTLGYRGAGYPAVTGLPNNQAIFDNSAVLGRTVSGSIRYSF